MQNQTCPVELSMSLISNKWRIFIIRDLLTGTKRFGELYKSLAPITQKMLTQNLRALEDNKIIIRTVYPVVPPKVEYSLTKLGHDLKPIIDSLKEFGEYYKKITK